MRSMVLCALLSWLLLRLGLGVGLARGEKALYDTNLADTDTLLKYKETGSNFKAPKGEP